MNYTKIAILLISFTVVVAQKNGTVTTSAPKNAQKNSTVTTSAPTNAKKSSTVTPTASKNAQNNSTVAATTATTTTTTTTAAETACDKCLEVIYGDCVWNEVIPGSKTDFHFEKSGVCPCPGDDKKIKCNVVQRRIRNIPALQAWSACLFLLSICIAGKIYKIIPYNFYD